MIPLNKSDPGFTREENYGIIILKNNYIIKFDDYTSYNEIFDGIRGGNKPIFDKIISSFNFSPSGLLN